MIASTVNVCIETNAKVNSQLLVLQAVLDEATAEWGIKVERVEMWGISSSQVCNNPIIQ